MKRYRYIVVVVLFLCSGADAYAQEVGQEHPYLCEIGIQGGIGYYVGDAAPHIFMNPREAYGLHFRYKLSRRWALQAKVSGQRIGGNDYDIKGVKLDTKWQNLLANADAIAEFNFFKFGSSSYDDRIKPYTPYIFIGLGIGVHDSNWIMPQNEADTCRVGAKVVGYVPVGIGFKWKFADRVGLNIAWQHNIYFADNIEGRKTLDNKHQLNGWNWMNCDVTGMLTIGLVIEFAPAEVPCRTCDWD